MKRSSPIVWLLTILFFSIVSPHFVIAQLPDLTAYQGWDADMQIRFRPNAIEICDDPAWLEYTFSVQNIGDANAAAHMIDFYLTENTTVGEPNDYFLAHSYPPGGILEPNEFSWFGRPFNDLRILGVPDGTYYIGWIIDPEDEILESDENNNTGVMMGQLTVTHCDDVNPPIPPIPPLPPQSCTFAVGDRVVYTSSLPTSIPGLNQGHSGTIVSVVDSGTVIVSWDFLTGLSLAACTSCGTPAPDIVYSPPGSTRLHNSSVIAKVVSVYGTIDFQGQYVFLYTQAGTTLLLSDPSLRYSGAVNDGDYVRCQGLLQYAGNCEAGVILHPVISKP